MCVIEMCLLSIASLRHPFCVDLMHDGVQHSAATPALFIPCGITRHLPEHLNEVSICLFQGKERRKTDPACKQFGR